jgi:hypothetical protein
MDSKLFLTSPAYPDLVLETIDHSHIEALRVWKNGRRECFFHKEEITPEQQERWYAGFIRRPDDYMFLAFSAGRLLGCIGFRKEAVWGDMYNALRNPDEPDAHGMTDVVELACSFGHARYGPPVGGVILLSNVYWSSRLERRGWSSGPLEQQHGLPCRRWIFGPALAVPVLTRDASLERVPPDPGSDRHSSLEPVLSGDRRFPVAD